MFGNSDGFAPLTQRGEQAQEDKGNPQSTTSAPVLLVLSLRSACLFGSYLKPSPLLDLRGRLSDERCTAGTRTIRLVRPPGLIDTYAVERIAEISFLRRAYASGSENCVAVYFAGKLARELA